MEKRKSKVILLPSDNITNIGKPVNELEYDKQGFDPHIVQTFEMYITTDDEIKEGDYFVEMTTNGYKVFKYRNNGHIFLASSKKIIATTDKSLILYDESKYIKSSPYVKYLPQPSQAFIEKYCKVGGIDEVLVEYVYNQDVLDEYNKEIDYNGNSFINLEDGVELKVDSHNTITIHPIKDSWTIMELLDKVDKDYSSISDKVFLKNFITNLY